MSLMYALVKEVPYGESRNLFQRRHRPGQRASEPRQNRGGDAASTLCSPDGGSPDGSLESVCSPGDQQTTLFRWLCSPIVLKDNKSGESFEWEVTPMKKFAFHRCLRLVPTMTSKQRHDLKIALDSRLHSRCHLSKANS